MEIEKVIDALTPLLCVFPQPRLSEEEIDEMILVYARSLCDLEEKELSAGVLRCIKTCTYFPKPAEIIEASRSVVNAANGTADKSPDEAWKEVMQQVHDAHIYGKRVFSTPEIEQAALSMGWVSLCETPVDQVGVVRAQFLRLYESVCKRKRDKVINDNVIQTIGAGNLIKSLSEKKKMIGSGQHE